jgi:methyl-accepting chemotaxis protein
MDQATQQNAALVEQTSAASAAMQEQADMLAQAVGAFRLDRTEVQPAAPRKTVVRKQLENDWAEF